MSRGPVSDPKTRSLEALYRTTSQSYEDCLGVREYIIMDIYWIISLLCREILFCAYEIHLIFHTYQTKQTDIIKQWQLIMVYLQLKSDIILGFR